MLPSPGLQSRQVFSIYCKFLLNVDLQTYGWLFVVGKMCMQYIYVCSIDFFPTLNEKIYGKLNSFSLISYIF